VIDWQLCAAGVLIGIAVAAPIGPINLMAIRNTLRGGFWHGLFTGLGAVLGDGTFAVVAAFGLTAVSAFVLDYASWIQISGALILIAVGVRTIFAPPADVSTAEATASRKSAVLVATTYVLTITNPATMMGFIAIFSGVGGLVSRPGDYIAAGAMVAAVMLGSTLWWVTIAWLSSLMQARIAGDWLKYINWGSGAVIALFGAGVLVKALWL
jgi:threonine/homoserine/homoserine lactone efflux protein